MHDTDQRHAVRQVTWCQTHDRYADDSVGCDTAADHDHYDIVLDEEGKTLFRVWPVGTTWRTPDGYTFRLHRYSREFVDMMYLDEHGDEGVDGRDAPERPHFSGQTPNGGAFGTAWLPGPDDVIVEYAPGEARPAPGSLYLRPNGETWRLTHYGPDWKDEQNPGAETFPAWRVSRPAAPTHGYFGASVLPEDARLVWAP